MDGRQRQADHEWMGDRDRRTMSGWATDGWRITDRRIKRGGRGGGLIRRIIFGWNIKADGLTVGGCGSQIIESRDSAG